ncbi:unnamed protein product [Pylaiella littoralis]
MYYVMANARTNDGTLEDLLFVKVGATTADQTQRSRDRGVVVPSSPTPVRELAVDLVRQNGLDIFHADALVKYTDWNLYIYLVSTLPGSRTEVHLLWLLLYFLFFHVSRRCSKTTRPLLLYHQCFAPPSDPDYF